MTTFVSICDLDICDKDKFQVPSLRAFTQISENTITQEVFEEYAKQGFKGLSIKI